ENASRINVCSAAAGIVPSRTPSMNADHTVAGDGTDGVSATPETIAHTTIAPTMPASGGPSSLTAHLARAILVHLPHKDRVDLRDDPRDEHVVEVAGPRRMDAELLEEPPGRGRHHQHTVRENDRLADVVRD